MVCLIYASLEPRCCKPFERQELRTVLKGDFGVRWRSAPPPRRPFKIFVFEMCRKHQISAIHGGCEYRVITSTLGARVYDAVRSRHWLSPALEANMRNRSLNQIALVGTFALLSTTVSYGDSAHLPRASYIKCLYQANGQILCRSTDVIKSLLEFEENKAARPQCVGDAEACQQNSDCCSNDCGFSDACGGNCCYPDDD